MATPSIKSSNADRGSANAAMNGARRVPCGVAGSPPFVQARDLVAPLRERRRRIPISGLVHRVIDGAAEIPHRDDGVALVGGQREKGIVEARRAPAHTPFHNSARAISDGASIIPSVGLNMKTL